MLSIGLMSGTSMDGIDAALLETDGTNALLKELGHLSLNYDPAFKLLLKSAEYTIRKQMGNMQEASANFPQALQDYLRQINIANIPDKIAELSRYIQVPLTLDNVIQHSTKLHAIATQQLLKQTGYTTKQIDVVGYHGQAMFHQPAKKISIIVGDGQYLADQVGIPVVNDFRSRDVAAGGQGAPFAPLYHHALAQRDRKIPVAILNCGGIANLTLINSANEMDLIAFDTGPGNGLIDKLVRQRTHGKEDMDKNGQYGQQGVVHEAVLQALYETAILKDGHSYFTILPPKALDIGDMELIPALQTLSLEDACRTLEAFTADTIINSLSLVKTTIPAHWILAGGGWNNPVIRHELETRLNKRLGKQARVQTADEAGWNSQALEAQIFAYLAVRSLQKKPLSLPNTTRVSEPMTGGCVYLPRS